MGRHAVGNAREESKGEALTKAPKLGPNVPSRGNVFSHWLGRTSYRLTGWHFVGALPDLPKFVIIVAPHTSNWDFLVGVGALFGLHLRVAYLAKDSLFHPPMAAIMRWLGGIPVDHWKLACRNLGQLIWTTQPCAANVAAYNYSVWLALDANPEGAFLSIGDSVGNNWPAGVRIFAGSVGKVARNIRSSVERTKLLDFTIRHDYIIRFWKE